MVIGRALGVRVGGKAVLGLGDAHREIAKPGFLQFVEAVFDGAVAGDVAGAIDLLGDRLDLVAQRHLIGIENAELGAAAFGELDDGVGKLRRAFAAARPMVGDHRLDPHPGAQLLQPAKLGFGIGAEAVDRDHRRNPEPAQVFERALQIGEALFDGRDILRPKPIARRHSPP